MLYSITQRSISPASGRVATRAGKTPSKGVVPERGAERNPARSPVSRLVSVASGSPRSIPEWPRVCARAGDISSPSLPDHHAIACIVRNYRGKHRARSASQKVKMVFDWRSQFHLKGRVSDFPIRVFRFGFGSEKILTTSFGFLPFSHKKFPNIT